MYGVWHNILGYSLTGLLGGQQNKRISFFILAARTTIFQELRICNDTFIFW